MATIIGLTPGETKPRLVEIHRRQGNVVSIWIHPPDSDEESGWEALVEIDKLRKALTEEGIL
jgi:hypothetical protein